MSDQTLDQAAQGPSGYATGGGSSGGGTAGSAGGLLLQTGTLPPGSPIAASAGTAGTPSAQVVSVQGVPGGTPQSVNGTVTVSGTVNVSSAPTTPVGGQAANGAPVTGNPVLIGGSDGTNVDSLAVDTSGRAKVVGAAANAAAAAGNPVLMGGVDSAGNVEQVLTDKFGSLNATPPQKGAWTLNNTSAAAAQATATQPAGATGVKNVCTMFSGQLNGDGTGNADQATINLRDGATGAGTILSSIRVSLPTGANGVGIPFALNGHWIGSPATAMTVEMSAAGATHTLGIVNAVGYQTK